METTKPKVGRTPVQTTDQAFERSPAPPAVAPHREPQATLPDGVPSVLWEEAVESERYVADNPEHNR
jgi:hypothetical protein